MPQRTEKTAPDAPPNCAVVPKKKRAMFTPRPQAEGLFRQSARCGSRHVGFSSRRADASRGSASARDSTQGFVLPEDGRFPRAASARDSTQGFVRTGGRTLPANPPRRAIRRKGSSVPEDGRFPRIRHGARFDARVRAYRRSDASRGSATARDSTQGFVLPEVGRFPRAASVRIRHGDSFRTDCGRACLPGRASVRALPYFSASVSSPNHSGRWKSGRKWTMGAQEPKWGWIVSSHL